jgi:hypothetical protein
MSVLFHNESSALILFHAEEVSMRDIPTGVSEVGRSRHFDRGPLTPGLPLMIGRPRSSSACPKSGERRPFAFSLANA